MTVQSKQKAFHIVRSSVGYIKKTSIFNRAALPPPISNPPYQTGSNNNNYWPAITFLVEITQPGWFLSEFHGFKNSEPCLRFSPLGSNMPFRLAVGVIFKQKPSSSTVDFFFLSYGDRAQLNNLLVGFIYMIPCCPCQVERLTCAHRTRVTIS